MVTGTVVIFEAVHLGTLDWRVSVNGSTDHVPFASRDTCIAAASARARLHHISHGVTTEVWAPTYNRESECIVRYMTPSDLEEMLRRSVPESQLREASYAYGPLFPIRE
ncbi:MULTISPECIES: hypothetical protein [unclassified Lysobacter]|uniref:hypothetical protein n=1 Tax=unclassified Lysobacter TaxID=2635362 RepID=UPI001BE68A45|nr:MULTISPECIES: hypothetical protein [unclassified Lysobacter]MBT2748318.1 hypothetical protein [Lysobacter sp. ISL-42]MBT2749915.1 hypothetical protein [Lysobacter sp. ISL-50]MBT2781243.1 hypothetical protein [Lysobacter sp. ISL-52]